MHISEQQLHLLVQDKLPPEELLQIQDHLIECQACAKTLADFLTVGQSFEQRRQPRSACDITAHIYVLSPAEMRTEGRVVDTSETGLRVRLPKALLLGSLVQIRTKDAIYMGEVRHCQNTIAGFEAGVRVIVTTHI
jgi:anti-sigma factor RsiW